MRIVSVTADDGSPAGRLRARHYHRAAAAALPDQVPLATSDPALAAVVRAEDGKIHPLSDSKGLKP